MRPSLAARAALALAAALLLACLAGCPGSTPRVVLYSAQDQEFAAGPFCSGWRPSWVLVWTVWRFTMLLMDQMEPRSPAKEIAEFHQVDHALRDQLSRSLEESERSEDCFRDLFEEAPIAYLYEDIDSRIIRANRSAMRMLGLKTEEVPGIFGKSLIVNSPENHSGSARW